MQRLVLCWKCALIFSFGPVSNFNNTNVQSTLHWAPLSDSIEINQKLSFGGVADLNVGKTAPSAGKGQVGEYMLAKQWRIRRPFKSWAESACPCSNNSHYETVIVLFRWKWGIMVQWQEHRMKVCLWSWFSLHLFYFYFFILVTLRKSLLQNSSLGSEVDNNTWTSYLSVI